MVLARRKNTYGHYSHNRFIDSSGNKVDEIALNPSYFLVVPIEEIMQTLVHEMTHQWQQHFGKPSKRSYHNKEWGNKMESIGLMPSSTGKEGGKKTGEQMMDYIIKGGKFESALKKLLTESSPISMIKIQIENGELDPETDLEPLGVELSNTGEIVPINEIKPTRVKFTCPSCNDNAWGKASLDINCNLCNVKFEPNGF